MSEFDPPEDYFDRDENGFVINGEGTYKEIAKALLLDGLPVVFPWINRKAPGWTF